MSRSRAVAAILELTQKTPVSEEKALRERYFGHEHVTVIEPIRGWRSLDLREIWGYRELLFALTMRDIKVRYKQTIAGDGDDKQRLERKAVSLEPDDFVIATGSAHSLEDFTAAAFGELGLDWRDHVELDHDLERPSDVMCSKGNAAKAHAELGWKSSNAMPDVVRMMVQAEFDDGRVG